jgi:hypothetical protein
VTGGFAWTYDQFTRTQLTDSLTGSAPAGTVETSFLGRVGWTVGAGAEVPIAPGWTARFSNTSIRNTETRALRFRLAGNVSSQTYPRSRSAGG